MSHFFPNVSYIIINMKKMILITVLGASSFLVGCSFAPIGENKFDCNRKDAPEGYCRNVHAVLESTDGTVPATKYGQKFDIEDYDAAVGYTDGVVEKKGGKDGKGGVVVVGGGLPHNAGVKMERIEGAPVRQAPVIQKVFIKPFVDENDILHEGGVAFKEVQTGKWTGFDRINAANNLAGGNVYPHRVKGNSALFVENSIDNGTDDTSVPQQAFVQPGVQSPAGGLVQSPANSNGDISMPR